MINQILLKDLGKRNIFTKVASQIMSERSIWPQRLYFWRLHANLSDQSALNCTVTGHVSWVFQYYLETRQQGWHGHP